MALPANEVVQVTGLDVTTDSATETFVAVDHLEVNAASQNAASHYGTREPTFFRLHPIARVISSNVV
ncbi:hypothetical protein RBSH_02021 [Rhodopirellula baltica SH28]|uniref:Uncharacterized protein n=2 Tax=Rhodopirellula baltica TaxID=265606 RepID=F2AMP4_RHOBT|nr:hypothetical protein RBWH47_02526 [Rhodopirellula baltica WH47]EKK02668.1 hypothetical protein RBSH_02021 [Rhodopirellula baltica SH28]